MTPSLPKLLLRLLHPVRLYRALRAARRAERTDRTDLDPQLRLYARILDHGHLHYGYFEDTDLEGAAISLADLREAQRAYARLLLDHLPDDDRPVLDCGCGMGGLLRLLADRGRAAVGVTPDAAQVEYLERTLEEVPVHRTTFEALDTRRHAATYGAVVCSESFQYLDLERAVQVAGEILAPGGRWIICDYFRLHEEAHEDSGHLLEAFREAVAEGGWSVREERDITEHVIGTLDYAHALADGIGRPLVDFLVGKLRAKKPTLYHLYREEIERLDGRLRREMGTIDPEQFRRDKSYRLFVLERG